MAFAFANYHSWFDRSTENGRPAYGISMVANIGLSYGKLFCHIFITSDNEYYVNFMVSPWQITIHPHSFHLGVSPAMVDQKDICVWRA